MRFTRPNGPLYQVTRASDSATHDIRSVPAGGVADAAGQNPFCAHTTCQITEIFDQSPRHNNLTVEGRATQGPVDIGAVANALPVQVNSHLAYGVKLSAGVGHRDNTATGVAVRDQPEGVYMVAFGAYANDRCCFDYDKCRKNQHGHRQRPYGRRHP